MCQGEWGPHQGEFLFLQGHRIEWTHCADEGLLQHSWEAFEMTRPAWCQSSLKVFDHFCVTEVWTHFLDNDKDMQCVPKEHCYRARVRFWHMVELYRHCIAYQTWYVANICTQNAYSRQFTIVHSNRNTEATKLLQKSWYSVKAESSFACESSSGHACVFQGAMHERRLLLSYV